VDRLGIEAVSEHGAVGRLTGIVPWTGDPEELHRFLNDPDEGLWGANPHLSRHTCGITAPEDRPE
jgi:hypothetical protein